MKQVVQSFKTGEMEVKEVPLPQLQSKYVLVENATSLISAGTEKGTVKVAKASLIEKARQRPDLVKQVIQNMKKEGIRATFDKVKSKLDSPKALGYSTAGIVKASLDSNNLFKTGDRVACAGQDLASHAEVVSVPQNLVAKIPDNVTFEEAAFTTVGAIALQGVRQSEPKLGENICVIGLGLIGQITCQLLRASGANVFGVDLSDKLVELASKHSADVANNRNNSNLLVNCLAFTNGHGFDKIIITAATPSNDPIELSAEIARKKGSVIMVGAVGMNIPRDPHFYRKELDLKMSCSYGPGRYDTSYEELGQDYPIAYVRWTEQRNMEAFLNAISKKQVNLKPLITHQFTIDNALAAYEMVINPEAEFNLGVLLEYPERAEKFETPKEQKKIISDPKNPNVSFIGAGSFAQSYLIPNIKSAGGTLQAVTTGRGINAEHVASKFGFVKFESDPTTIFKDENCNTIFIATRHNTHANYAIDALSEGKNVFVEKPLALNTEELEKVSNVYSNSGKLLMVGFNRRFSRAAQEVNKLFNSYDGPLAFNFRVNAGALPPDHWAINDEIGGGRIIGEVCHFIDLMQYFSNSLVKSVYAQSLPGTSEVNTNADNVIITLTFKNGSVGNITYLANGDKALPKEHLEVFGGGNSAIINDFNRVSLYKNGSLKKVKTSGKGHKEEVMAFLKAISDGTDSPISFDSIYSTTLTTFKVIDSMATGLPQHL
ncbi:bi-domain-containing oxidoreductase [Fulvivirga sp.]|uniref:bi-domain-containing oxidoreductase n=1 Tax=Fulvivirga sp. TaxID=1931237 RepID=UPI0032ED93E9